MSDDTPGSRADLEREIVRRVGGDPDLLWIGSVELRSEGPEWWVTWESVKSIDAQTAWSLIQMVNGHG